jgi:monoamine oxidase
MLGFYIITCKMFSGGAMPRITRRDFIAGVGAGLLPLSHKAGATGNREKVIVVGAGLAGLAAAYDLFEAGADVTVIEKSGRAGGRVKTIRGYFADNAWVDVGGQTTGAMYANFFVYASKLGLQFEKQDPVTQRPDVLLHLQDKLYSATQLRQDPSMWPVALTDEEKPLAPFRLLSHYLGPIAKEIGTVGNVLNPEFISYDKLTLRELLEQRGASAAAIKQIDHTLNYNSVDTVSALSALRDTVRAQAMRGGQALNLENGNESLPEAFAKHLGDSVHYQQTLKAVLQKESGIELQVETKGLRESLYADRVIIAIPFTALRKVQFEPGLPAQRQRIIDELPYTQIAQTYLQTKTRFWEQDSPVAMVVSDGPLERVFNASTKMKGERGLLVNWINGIGTQTIAAQDPEKHLDNVLNNMEAVWPGCREHIETTLTNNWSNTYVRGAYAHYAPGQMAAHAATIAQPIGAMHFAGEHTELVAPGMEGALTSGKRAATEIIEANYN